MDHKLRLYHVGPIQECDLDLNDFTVLTGPQSSGKSTVAKAVYFFRTVKQDILKKHTLEGVISLNKDTFYRVGTVPPEEQIPAAFWDLLGHAAGYEDGIHL